MAGRSDRVRPETDRRTLHFLPSCASRFDDGIVVVGVPEISRFFGIVIGMFYSEHGVPHFHASYAEYEVSVEIETGTIRGDFPKRAARLVLEWRALHKQELLENWRLARSGKSPKGIAPLE